MRATLLFPGLRQVHLTKDPGCVVHYLAKQGFTANILCTRNDEYRTKGFLPKIEFVKKPFFPRAIARLWRDAKNIDVLILFHTHPLNPIYASVFRMRNSQGIVYLKADMDNTLLDLPRATPLNLIRRCKIRMNLCTADVLSIEQGKVLALIKQRYSRYAHKMIHVPNGYGEYNLKDRKPPALSEKRNIILCVGPVGSMQKGTDIMLDVFERIKRQLRGWKVVMAGKVEDAFRPALDAFFTRNPELRDVIELRGNVSDRTEMIALFRSAKIMFMPSRFESFSLALCEAAYYGDVIIATPVGGAEELTDGGTFGAVCAFGDINAMARAITRRMKDQMLLRRESAATLAHCRKYYTWGTISVPLARRLRQELEKKKR